ncbi:MAG: pyridoxal phosphate-dependent aminotransferase, partial [Deltaproteobacteria bacterium]
MQSIPLNGNAQALAMPENMRIAKMISIHRKKCEEMGCDFDYAAFAFGQSPFPPPAPLVKALKASAHEAHYLPAEGLEDLRKMVCSFNRRHFGTHVTPERVIVGPGTKSLIYLVFSLIDADVLIPSPSWIGYFPQAKLLGKNVHVLHLGREDHYKLTPEKLERFLHTHPARRKLLVLNNPHNPTGNVYSRRELEELVRICRKYGLLVLSDEIYALTARNPSAFCSLAELYPEGAFITNGLSKDRSAGGYRLGTLILPDGAEKELTELFWKVSATLFTSTAAPIQHAAMVAYDDNEEINRYIALTRTIHSLMGRYLSEMVSEIPGLYVTKPEGGFYFYVDFNDMREELVLSGIYDSNALGKALLSHPYHVATVTGDACLLEPENFGARFAFVDYDGEKSLSDFQLFPPQTEEEERR